jgi:PKD repeat protein
MKFICLLFFVYSGLLYSQQFCNTDQVHERLFTGQPQYNNHIINSKAKLEFETQQFNLHNRAGATYVIPVVFHVIHQNGLENISEEQIIDQIAILNSDYATYDTSVIIDYFKPLVANCDIEFRLATKDPNGNCTNGITRHVSSLTTTGDHAVKSIVHWPPNMYLNFYVVSNAAGLAGHALLPYVADSLPLWDGIVMSHSYIGSIGTSSVSTSVVASHEVGHYLNLQHVWGGNNVPNFPYLPVGDAGNCSYDDGVGDTPNTTGNQSCSLSSTNCSSLDNVQNFMDYSYCGAMFTLGQKTRMHACLNSTIANRNNLWSPANLIATGIDTAYQVLCEVDFKSDRLYACVGDTVVFHDKSYHKINSRVWNFYGGVTSSLTDSVVKVVYNTPGNYDVKLVVYNGATSDSITKNQYITINPTTTVFNYMTDDFEGYVNFPDNKWSVGDDSVTFQITNSVGFNSNSSLLYTNFSASSTAEFTSTTIDLSNYSNVEVKFDYAYAEKETSSKDKLNVYYSSDCGKTWTLRRSYLSYVLLTKYTADTNSFSPQSSSEWKSVSLSVGSGFLVDNFQVKFEFLGTPQGNNIYLDNINVVDPVTISINENWKEKVKVFPNPANEILFIDNIKKGTQIQIIDVTGKYITAFYSENIKEVINTKFLTPGVYFILLNNKEEFFMEKIIKK